MASFSYVAKDQKGKIIQGVLDATNQQEVIQRLRKDNLFITQINAVGQERAKNAAANSTFGRVTLKERLFFSKQFYVMLKAGLGMTASLNNLFNQTDNKYFKFVINEVRRDVESGRTLSEAFARQPKVFDKMFIHMVEAGEASGKLDVSFNRMNEYYEREYKLRKEVTSALVYPTIIICAAVIAVVVLMTVVMPTFAKIFADSGKPLPLITQVVVGASTIMREFWYLLPVVPVGGFFGYRAIRNNPVGSAALDRFWLGVPVFGELIRKLAVSRFTRTLATLMESGVPILQCLEIVQRAVNNAVVAQGVKAATLGVSRGTGLSQPLENSGIFPPMVSQMVAVGEETGDLARMLTEVADYYDKEVGYAVENMTTMIEPLVIVFLGVVIGVIVVSIYLPMFDLSSGATLH